MVSSTQALPELVSRCLQRGKSEDWEALIESLRPMVSGVASRSAARWGETRRDQVEDLTQEAFLKFCKDECLILRQLSGKPEGMMIAFLKVAVANLVHDHFRAQRSGRRYPAAGLLSADVLDQWLGETQTVDAVQRDLLLQEVDQIIARKLTGPTAARDRRIFWLYHRHGMTAKDIAAIPAIGLSDKGVESAVYRVTGLVKEELTALKGNLP